jgi:tRNA G10  N-methylase Trm11
MFVINVHRSVFSQLICRNKLILLATRSATMCNQIQQKQCHSDQSRNNCEFRIENRIFEMHFFNKWKHCQFEFFFTVVVIFLKKSCVVKRVERKKEKKEKKRCERSEVI